jgi:hypothetical protein
MLVALGWAGAALAQEKPNDEKSAVELARAAFEFRDFQKVIDVLRPWVRPMRIRERELQVEARSLTGVSLHLLGRVDEAREEFGDLLLLEPKHELDPFVVPPEVIATFEAVRRELKPTLDEILRERGENPEPDPSLNLRVVTLPHPAISILPFGIPQFIVDQPAWGTSFAVLQTLGIAGNVTGWIASREAGNRRDYEIWRAVQYASLALTVLAYVGGVVQSVILLNDLEADVQPTP